MRARFAGGTARGGRLRGLASSGCENPAGGRCEVATGKVFDCVLCGSCVVDILVRPVRLDAAIGGGRLIHVEPIEVTTGGIVSNSGIAMARLGMRVAAFSLVGDDEWAS
ncbi:MAG: hypothetical protein FJ276_27165, partial [Planctomycetes bacterium]|nr:hypothetical protein [Planctomycetota bacterium]